MRYKADLRLPSDAAIILSLEAVFAALSGWIFLSERLNLNQLLGCALILSKSRNDQEKPENRGYGHTPVAPVFGNSFNFREVLIIADASKYFL